ncbi:MAG: ribosome biogenesis GTP-binding protein YihA/YsxC [Bacteroidales bacterium]|nr:ribosome biogenesis GTP-binding protein YihA/YsxC [Bacteroidales bacterium]
MQVKKAEFVISNTNVDKCPTGEKPEYAFIGRSNVGKSSVINMLCGRKNLAKTSSTPGKTQLINHFIIDDGWYLVDLPGFGFAKSSKKEREKWRKMINSYLLKRENLLCSFFLIDSRIAPQKNDTEFINWFGANKLPFVLIFTKTDKLKVHQLSKNIEAYRKHLYESWEELPLMILTSSKTALGKNEVLDYIDQNNRMFFETGLS